MTRSMPIRAGDFMFCGMLSDPGGTRRRRVGFAIAALWFVASSATPSRAIPAFARKYGLPCSACHLGWPILNSFGQSFRDNGYQLGNERDSPIYQNPSYLPITFRITPQWHLEHKNHVPIDSA